MTQYSTYAFIKKRHCKKFINEVIKTGVKYTLKKKNRSYRNMCKPLLDFYKTIGIYDIRWEVECIVTDEQVKKLDDAYCRITGPY